MKRNILTSTLAVATLVAVVAISQSASAAKPEAKFLAMKRAVLQQARKKVDQGSWRLVDGHIMELSMELSILSASSTGLSDQGAKPLQDDPRPSSRRFMRVVALTFDLNEKLYGPMSFGQDEYELIFSVKGSSNTRYLIDLDHKTNTPVYLALQSNEKGAWKVQINWRDYANDRIAKP